MDYQSRVFWHREKNKKILIADYSGLIGDDLMGVFNISYNTQKTAGTNVLLLTEFTDAKANDEIVNALKKAGKELDQDMKKIAVVGLTTIQRIIYQGYIRFTGQSDKVHLFNNRTEAIQWLVS